MKSRKDSLQQLISTPGRDLSADFTNRILSQIKASPSVRHKEKGMKSSFRTVVASIVAIVLVATGSLATYAATDGFTKPFDWNRILGYQEIIQSNGDKIIAVKTTNCSIVQDGGDSADRLLWFRPKSDSSVNTNEVVQWVQGYCETIYKEDVMDILERNSISTDYLSPLASHGLITAVDANSVSIVYANTTMEPIKYTFLGNALLLDGGETVSIEHFKVDDYVEYVVNKPIDITDDNQVVYMSKLSDNAKLYIDKYDTFSKDAERVQPCGDDEFCKYGHVTEGALDDDMVKARNYITHAYEEYLDSLAKGSTDINLPPVDSRDIFTKYTTPELAHKLHRPYPANMLTCSQDFNPAQTTYGLPVRSGNLITVPTIRSWGELGVAKIEVFADVVYDVQKEKISDLTCLIEMGLK